jgi:hypothetical protein
MKFAAVLLLFVFAAPAAEVQYFRYTRPVELVPQTSGQTCMAVPADVFAHAAPGLADLRLYRGDMETPYALETTAAATPGEQQIAPLNLGRRANHTVFDVVMPDGKYSDLNLSVEGQDFLATVTVTGSQTESGAAPTKLGSFTIFDLTKQKLGRSTVLHLPESDFRYLHLGIDGPIAADAVRGISVSRLPSAEPRYLTVAATASMAQKGRTSVAEFTVPAHVPVDRVVFAVGGQPANFGRAVSVSARPVVSKKALDVAEPQPVTFAGSLLRVHRVENGQRIDEEQLSLDAQGQSFDLPAKWTVTVDNGDDAPVAFSAVRLEMLERKLCFDAAAGAQYKLDYGDAALEQPRYDYARLFVAQPGAAQATAGAEQDNPGYRPRPDARPFTERHPVLLWVALIVVVGVLGAIALRTGNAVKQDPS